MPQTSAEGYHEAGPMTDVAQSPQPDEASYGNGG